MLFSKSLAAAALLLPAAIASPLVHFQTPDPAFDSLIIDTVLDSAPVSYTPLEPRAHARNRAKCTALHVIAVSGAGPNSGHMYGMLNTTVDAIKKLVPGVSNYSLPYVRSNNPSFFESSVAAGVVMLKQNLANYVEQCPDTPVMIIGYSEGGCIAMDTICGWSRLGHTGQTPALNTTYLNNIMAIVTYGQETHVPNQPWNTGTCLTGYGMAPRGNSSTCSPFGSRIQDFSLLNDPDACSGSPNPKGIIHDYYPQIYSTTVATYVQAKLTAWATTPRS